METRHFGRLGPVSALTLGGGGIAGVWGRTDRAEAVATIHAAVDGGITMLDLAPSYGENAESELAAGEALRGRAADHLLITSKVQLPDEDADFAGRIGRSLRASLTRLGRDHLDLLLLHTQLRPPAGGEPVPHNLAHRPYRDQVVPELERLRDAGLIRAWGITAVGHPAGVLAALRETPAPTPPRWSSTPSTPRATCGRGATCHPPTTRSAAPRPTTAWRSSASGRSPPAP